MPTTLLVSITAADRIGLVAALTGCVFDLGGNLADTTFAVLGEGAKFSGVAEFHDDISPDTLQAELTALDELSGAEINIRPFDHAAVHGPQGRLTHRVVVSGGDRPGLIARLSEVFGEFDGNIVRLNAERIPSGATGNSEDDYAVTFGVSLPSEKVQTCMATVSNTAGELGLNCRWYEVRV